MNKSAAPNFDPVLLDQLRQGKPQAFETLYKQYYRLVAKLVSDFQVAGIDPQDVFQDVLFILVKKVRDPQFSLSAKFSTLIYAIAKNIMLKKTGKKVEFSVDEAAILKFGSGIPDPDSGSRAEEETLIGIVHEKLGELEEDCRQVIMMSFYEKLPHSKIAEILKYSEAFVKVKKFRCLDYLRNLLKTNALFQNL